MTLDLDTGRVIPQDLDADFSLVMADDDGELHWLLDEGTPIMGIHRVEWEGEEYDVTVEIKRVNE